MGHSNISITLDTYSHVLQDAQKEAAEKMDNFLSSTKETIPIKVVGFANSLQFKIIHTIMLINKKGKTPCNLDIYLIARVTKYYRDVAQFGSVQV